MTSQRLSPETYARRLIFGLKNPVRELSPSAHRVRYPQSVPAPYNTFEMWILYCVFAWALGVFTGACLSNLVR